MRQKAKKKVFNLLLRMKVAIPVNLCPTWKV